MYRLSVTFNDGTHVLIRSPNPDNCYTGLTAYQATHTVIRNCQFSGNGIKLQFDHGTALWWVNDQLKAVIEEDIKGLTGTIRRQWEYERKRQQKGVG